MKNKLKIIISISLFALLIIGAVVLYNALQDKVPAAEETSSSGGTTDTIKAVDFIVQDGDGNSVGLSDIIAKGKPVVVNFWASWCGPCKSEMPDFDTVYKELGAEVEFMMINLTDGQRETVAAASMYIEEQSYTFPVYFDVSTDAAYAYGIQSIPTTIFIDKDGNIVTGKAGAMSESELRRFIDQIR